MTAADCPDPTGCPVPDPPGWDLHRLRTATLPTGATFHTVYRTAHPDLFNRSGRGDSRFSPLLDVDGHPVPTLYGAATRTAALLETAFHEVAPSGARVIYEATDIRGRGLATLDTPHRVSLFDLRDPALGDLGLTRAALVATAPRHYRCTREWAAHLRGRGVGRAHPVGILWHSRIAELARAGSPLFDDLLRETTVEVFVLFGDTIPTDWSAYGPRSREPDLTSGPGRALLDAIAHELGAVIT